MTTNTNGHQPALISAINMITPEMIEELEMPVRRHFVSKKNESDIAKFIVNEYFWPSALTTEDSFIRVLYEEQLLDIVEFIPEIDYMSTKLSEKGEAVFCFILL